MAKIVKTLTISWQWSGDKYSLQGFNLAITPATKNPKEEVVATAFVETKEIKETYSYKMGNVTLDKDAQYKIWVQAVYENSDSDWVSTGGATVTDDGSATIITKTDREIQDIVNMASDNILTRQEKISLRREWQEIVYEFLEIESTAISQGIPSSNTIFSNFKSKGNALGTYLNGGTTWTISSSNKTSFPLWINDSNLASNTSINGNTYRETFRVYYEAKVKILEEINKYKVNNVQIGAINIIRNSSNPKTLTHWKNDTGFSVERSTLLGENVFRILTTDAAEKFGATQRYKVEPNCQYTFAMDVYMDANVTSMDVFWLSREKGSSSDYDSVTHFIQAWKDTKSKWVRITGTFTTKATDYEGYIRIDNNGTTNSTTLNGLWFTKVKLEKGNKATDWSPALEDMENAYTIILTNEAQVIPTSSNRVPTSSTTYFTDIQVYKGTTQRNDYTIGTINSANGITVSKTSSRVNFAVSTNTALAADGGNFVIPITIDGKTFNKTFSWSCSKQGNTGAIGATGPAGQNAQHVVVTGEQVFKYANNFSGTPTPATITLTATKINTTATGKWQWLNGSTWTDWISGGPAATATTLSVLPTSGSLNTGKSIRIRYIVGSVYDEITIVKVSDGTNGTNGADAYTVILTNETHTFPTQNNGNISTALSTTTQVMAYKGASSVTPTIGTLPSVAGLTLSKSGTTVTVQANAGTSLADSGSFNIPVTVDSKSFTKTFSWSKAKQGNTGATGNAGQDAITIVLSNENHTFPCESNGNIPAALSTTCVVTAYKGGTSVTPTIGAITNPTGMTITKNGATLTIQANTGTSLADSGTVNIPIFVDGKTFNKTFTWSKAKKGATGATGAGAKTVDIIASSQVFKSTDGGLTFSPATIKLTPKLQNVTYSNWQYSTNGGSSWTNVVSGEKGLSIDSSNKVLTVSKDSSLFTSTVTSVAFRLNTNDSSVYDTMTIVKLYDVADLEIGGRNLISKNYVSKNNTSGSFNSSTNTWNLTATAGAGGIWGCGLVLTGNKILVPYGKTYVLSFEIKVPRTCSWNADVNNFPASGSYWNSNDNDEIAKRKTSSKSLVANQWVKCWVLWSNTHSSNTNKVDLYDNTNFGIVMKDETSDMTFQIRNIKGELGMIPTDWTPAPEDVATDINTAKNEAINSANNTLTTTIANYYTKEQTNSQIDVAKEAINLGVSSTYETKANVETKITSTLNNAKSYADTKKNEAINTASSDATNKVNSAKNELNTAINKKANSSDVYSKAEVYTKGQTDSAIKVAKDEINIGVSNTYETKANVETKITSIQVGGTNLAYDTNKGATGWGWDIQTNNGKTISGQIIDGINVVKMVKDGTSGSGWNYVNYGRFKRNKITPATTYMASFEIKSNMSFNVGSINLMQGDSTNSLVKTITAVQNKVTANSTSWNKIVFKLTTLDTLPSSTSQVIYITGIPATANAIHYIRNLKLEEGNKATTWSPAPEDITTDITTAKNEAINSANNTLTTTIANYYTKEQTNSQINVAKEAINLGVSSTYETKANVETKVTSTLNSAKSYSDTKKTEAINAAATDAANKVNSAKNELNTAIGKKANSADVYTKSEVYTKTQTDSQINVAKNAITQSVSSTYETKTEVANKINAIQVGSRNWVQNSAFKSTTGWTLSSGWSVNSSEKFRNNNSMYINRSGLTADSWSELRSNKINVKQGDKLVGSWYIKHRDCDMNSIVELWGYKADGSGRVSIAKLYQFSGTNANWTRYVLKGTVPANVDYVQLAISHRRNGIIYAAMPQVEYGNTATDWSPSPDDMETIVSSIEKRVSKAEQKITDSAIIQTVSQTINQTKTEAINSANSNTANQLKNYSTTQQMNSAIQQKADSITSEVVKIENSMAIDNLLANGNFTNGLNNWHYRDYGSSVNYTLTANTDWTMVGKTALLITQSQHPQGCDSGFTQEIEVKPNTNYTFTGYIASHRAEGMAIVKDEAGNWLVFDKTDADYDQYTGGADVSKWKRVRLVYYSGNRNKLQLHLALAKSNDNGHVWFHDFMVTEGDTDLCWKPSEKETRTKIAQLSDRITSTVSSIQTVDGKVNQAQSQIDQQAHQIASKVNSGDFSSLIQQNGHSVMVSINNSRGSMGIGLDSSGMYGYNNGIATFRLTEGKFHAYNSWNGQHMGYFGTNGDDLRACLYGTNTFSVFSNDSALLFRARYERDARYGNATLDMCGGINFIHKPGQDVGVNQILLGNDDRSDAYGYHNMSIRCWNSLGFQDNYGLTNMFFDVRRGRIIMKGGLYQNTQTPPSAYVLSNDPRNPFYSGVSSEQMVNSILNLETTVKVDTDDDVTMMILPNDDDLAMTMIDNQQHVDIASIVAGLVETVKSLNNRVLELESKLSK